MIRINENTFQLTRQELQDIYHFIDDALYQMWDRHTDKFICNDSLEDGKRRMDKQSYDLAQEIDNLLSEEE